MASLVLLFQRYRHFTGIVLNLYKPEKDIGFPGSSAGKESACNVGDPSLIPGLGRSAGEGVGYPLQYSCASLVAQLKKNLPVMQEIWVRSLGWEDPLEEGMTTLSSILAWKIRRDRGAWQGYSSWGHKELDMTERPLLSLFFMKYSVRNVKSETLHTTELSFTSFAFSFLKHYIYYAV